MPTGLSIAAEINGTTVSRPYTPISTKDQKGYADFVIKSYPPRTDGKAGNLAAHLCSLKVQDTVKMKGPWKKLAYEANKYPSVGMIAGGTGLTPMFQVLLEILNNPDDKTKVTLLYANKTEDDILLRQTLDEMASKSQGQFQVKYTLDQPPAAAWEGETGFVSSAMIQRSALPAPGSGSMVFICGPPPMMKAVCGPKSKKEQGEVGGVLQDMGYASSEIYKF
jgi:cytochrome-b5 reductase